jgi:hypothetical protein
MINRLLFKKIAGHYEIIKQDEKAMKALKNKNYLRQLPCAIRKKKERL